MKQTSFLLFAILFVSIASLQCSSSKKLVGPFKAKLVASLCGQHILQIEDDQHYESGMDWKEYKHVFTVANHCDFAKAGLKVGDIFNCVIVEKPTEENCMACQAFMETPELKHNVKVVQ